MNRRTLSAAVFLFVAGITGTLAPVRVSAGGTVLSAAAECTTCCSMASQLCVVCARTCTTVVSAYDNGGGACPP